MDIIKTSILETYKMKFESELKQKVECVMLIYKPNYSDIVNVTIKAEQGTASGNLEKKDTLFLKKLMLPKLKKEIKKEHGEKVKFISFTTSINFESKEISMFSEFIKDGIILNHLIII